MNQPMTFELTSEQATELEALLDHCVQEVRAAEARMEQSEAERLQMQAETRVMLQQLKGILHLDT